MTKLRTAGAVLVAVFLSACAAVDVPKISFSTPDGQTVEALWRHPGGGDVPVVVFHHGISVRCLGVEGARARGHDAEDFVRALNRHGYGVLAPLRCHLKNLNYADSVEAGASLADAALDVAKTLPGVRSDRVAMMGFSEGGLISLWAAGGRTDLSALVLLSPANMTAAGDFNLAQATAPDHLATVTAPVFVASSADDGEKIRLGVIEHLIPGLAALGHPAQAKTDYPGDHFWFRKPRSAYFDDVIAFLNAHLR